MEMPLAEAALRSGAANEFDRRIQSLETRVRQVLGCTPRESFVWLLAFNQEVLHGRLNEQSFNLLAMSYETSPNEAWISIRRIVVAMPLVLSAPEPVRHKILFEFQQLIRNGFADDAARSYLTASGSVRSLLQAQIEQLDLPRQKTFRMHCRNSVLNDLFPRIQDSCCVSFTSGIKKPNTSSQADDDLFGQPELVKFCHDTSDHGSARWLVPVRIIGVLLRAGVGELS